MKTDRTSSINQALALYEEAVVLSESGRVKDAVAVFGD